MENIEQVMLLISTISLLIIAFISVINIFISKDKIRKIVTTVFLSIILISLAGYSANNLLKEKNKKEYKEITINEYYRINKSKDKKILLITSATCSYCAKFSPIVKKVQKDLNIEINAFDINTITSDSVWKKFEAANSTLKTGQWGTPVMMVIENKKVVDTLSGYVEEEKLIEFLNNNGIGK